jgi:hypothetical protein
MATNDALLAYNGTVYRLPAVVVTELVAQGVIIPSRDGRGPFALGPEHLIDEVEPFATVLGRRSGAEARSGDDVAKQRMLALRYQHRDGQGAR